MSEHDEYRPRILLIDDEDIALSNMSHVLQKEGYEVTACKDGESGLDAMRRERFDLVLTDLNMPGMGGLEVLSRIKRLDADMEVIVLTGNATLENAIQALKENGAFDYLTKPFALAELQARLEALLRRGEMKHADTVLRVGNLELDRLTRVAQRGGRTIDLQPREYQLLEFVMLHAGQVVTRTMLLEGVWDYHFDPQTNVIDVHISRLRAKIDKGEERPLLQTVRGAGYCLRDPGAAADPP